MAVRRGKAQSLGPSQGGQHTAAAQRLADIMAKGPDIGPLGTGHINDTGPVLRVKFQQVQPVDGHLPGGPFHLFSGPGQLIQPLTIHPNGGIHRRQLVNGAPQRRQGCLQRFFCHRLFAGGKDIAGAVLGIGGHPKADGSGIALILYRHQLHGLGAAAKKERQHTGSHRVQGTAMAYFVAIGNAPHFGHHIKGGPVLRFIDT